MRISSRFTTDVHMLARMEVFKDAGLIGVKRGTGGATIAKPLGEITFRDVYGAVGCIEENTLFHFHEKTNADCPVGKNIHNILDDKLIRVQSAMEHELESISLADMIEDLEKYL